MILFDGTGTDPIYRVPAVGRNPDGRRRARRGAQGDVGRLAAVPAGRQALPLPGDRREARGQRVLDRLDRLEREDEARAGADARRSTRRPGYLLFVRDRTLVAQPFDAKALKTTGEPVPLAEKIGTDNVGLARFSVSSNGVLAYRTGETGRAPALAGAGRARSSTRWATRATTRIRRFSPSGDRLAFNLDRCPHRQGRHLDPRPRARRQLALHARRRQQLPARLVARRRDDRLQLGPRRDDRPLREVDEGLRRGEAAAPERRAQVGVELDAGRKVHRVTPAGTRRRCGTSGRCRRSETASRFRSPSVRSPRRQPMFSPDGRFVAYVSNESGREEIYVQTFPERRREVAGLQRRRHRSELAGRRQGALLPLAGPEAHGGRDPRRRRLPGRRAPAALSDSRPAGQPAQQVRAVAGRPAIPRRRAARPRRDEPDDDRPELAGDLGK